MKKEEHFRNVSGIPHNPSVVARVQCGVMGDQWVRPVAAEHHDECNRRNHVVRKRMNPRTAVPATTGT